jgi:hypothetical protein
VRGLAGAFDPINMFAGALLKDGDAVPRITNPPAKFLQFGLQKFIISPLATT